MSPVPPRSDRVSLIRTLLFLSSVCLFLASVIVALSGCDSPEAVRRRGGGEGGDGGNYHVRDAGVGRGDRRNAIHVPSKIDGTRTWPYRPKT